MAFMDWVLEVAAKHPDLQGAFITSDGEWLDVLLADGRTVRFRPGQMMDENAPEERRTQVLNRLISIGVTMAKPAESEDGAYEERSNSTFGPQAGQSSPGITGDFDSVAPEWNGEFDENSDTVDLEFSMPEDSSDHRVLPIVRSADYFVSSHKHDHDDSMVYVPLTSFVGVGLAEDKLETIEPIYFSDLDERGISHEIGPLFGSAIEQLRQLNAASGKPGLELGVTTVSGAKVFLFTAPENYQSSWFADVDMTQTVSESLTREYGDVLPLFIPASRNSLIVAMADDPQLPAMLKALRGRLHDKEAIYPLPHTVASDGWQEWIPMPDHPAAKILAELRTSFRGRIYDAQVEAMSSWPSEFGSLKAYEIRRMRSGQYISHAQWKSSDGAGSIPDTDYVTFVHEGSGLPWEDNRGNSVTLLSRVAREVWDGFTAMDGVWPPRYATTGFPSPEQMDNLRAAADREV